MTSVKICGITSLADALECTRLGANMLGFVFAQSPRQTDAQTVRNIRRVIGADIRFVGVFTEESDEVLKIADACELDYIQLHGNQSEAFAERIGGERVIRVIRVQDDASIDSLAEYAAAAFYLLDTYKRGLAGGTGETFDWDLAVRAKDFGKQIILSGGLGPDNVESAIEAVKPFGVDVSSKLEMEPGKKNYTLVKEFIDHVRSTN